MPSTPLRILLILENAGAGSGRHVIDLAQGLLRGGHEVTLIYSESRLEKWFARAIDDMTGLETYRVPMVRGPHPYDIVSLTRIRRLMAQRAQPWQIIHGHSSKGGALARLCGMFYGAARVYTPHAFITLDPELGGLKRKLYSTIERILAWQTEGLICVSKAEREHAMSLGIAPEKLTVIENCLNPLPPADRTAARKQMGLAETDVCIGFVGRLAPQKNIGRLLKAFAGLADRGREARLAIVGDGPEGDRLHATAKRLGIDSKLIWTGHADGPALMAGFDIFALPSDYEAFPYVLLEAAARSLPIVSMRIGGAEDVVDDGINGYVVDDVDQLGERLLQLVLDPHSRATMGRSSLERSGHFNVDRMVSRTLTYYYKLLGVS